MSIANVSLQGQKVWIHTEILYIFFMSSLLIILNETAGLLQGIDIFRHCSDTLFFVLKKQMRYNMPVIC